MICFDKQIPNVQKLNMDKIAGPYLHTLTGILGDKRSTMLESEVQLKVGINVTSDYR